jgi:hypothetical protein
MVSSSFESDYYSSDNKRFLLLKSESSDVVNPSAFYDLGSNINEGHFILDLVTSLCWTIAVIYAAGSIN